MAAPTDTRLRTQEEIVARAWTDPDFKKRLLADTTAACSEMGIGGLQGEEMVVVENTDTVHNAIVCTLCSCYPLRPRHRGQERVRPGRARDPRLHDRRRPAS